MAPAGGILNLGRLKLERHGCQKLFRQFLKTRPAPGSGSYYVLLPEVPTDTKDTNPLLRLEEFPKFSEITPELCVTGSAKRSIEFDVDVGNFLDTLKDAKEELTFEKIFDPIEKCLVPLSFSWATTKHLSFVRNDAPYKEAFSRIHSQVEKAKCQRWTNEDLINAIKDLNTKHRASLNECQRSLVDKYLLESKLNGIDLSKEDKTGFMAIAFKLAELKQHFRNKVSISGGLFSHTVTDYHMMSEFPKDALAQLSSNKEDPTKGPWTFTLNQGVYDTAMAHCSDRKNRWNLWYAYVNRASLDHQTQNLSNHSNIQEIRAYRQDVAKYLDFPSFAHMSVSTKMAGTVEQVSSFIQQLKQKFQPFAEEEIAILQGFATREGFAHKLMAWDIAYWRRRHLDHLHRLDISSLSNYFPLPRVLDYLFSYCRILFGLRFEDCSGSVEVWNEDVKFFKVYDDSSNKFMSSFYLDPYTRPETKIFGNWMEVGRDRSDIIGTTPFSYFGLNLNKPHDTNQPCLVTFNQLQNIFYQFGNGLQQLATTATYSEVSGPKNIELDAINTCSNLFKMILNTRQTLRTMSRHHETGEALPEDVIDTIMKRRHHMTSFDNMMNLYYSALDQQIHLDHKKTWFSLMQELYKEYVPFPLEEEDSHVCSFSPIFGENLHAAYYSQKWSEMLACDIFETFKSASKESPESVRAVGKRFRDTFLSLGGSVPSAEVFRRFQGRDPNIDALVSYYLH